MSGSSNWNTITESNFPWEREALDFVRQQFPAQEPYRAWSNFEFIATDGSINEVDLLVFTPQGFFLIEIKSRPGRLFGDAGIWTWETGGRLYTTSSPSIAANTKAKKLRSLLERQSACRGRGQIPFIEALVFCSAVDLRLELQGNALLRVCLRDLIPTGTRGARPGIMAAILQRDCPGVDPHPRGTYDRATVRMIGQAMEQAGIRSSDRHRKVGDYKLDQTIESGPGYQDWTATHTQISKAKRRIRIYLVRTESVEADRKMIARAALREFRLLETLQAHPAILRCDNYTDYELGPALIFEYDPAAVRLDHYLIQKKDALSASVRLKLLRQIAEVVRFAHEKKVVHRGLSPQSILVSEGSDGLPQIKLYNWQVGYSTDTSTAGTSREVTVTSHIDRLVEDESTAYLAPEALTDGGVIGEHLDVFSLGAIAFYLLSGKAPAENGLDLSSKLRETKGLQISSVLNGASERLQFLIQYSTHPEVSNRFDSVAQFLNVLDGVEQELLALEHNLVENPAQAQQGDLLPGNLTVIRRLGQGATSTALLVERDEQEFVLKVASDPEDNSRIRGEAEVLKSLRHPHIVAFCEPQEIGSRAAFLMRPVFVERDKKRIETLAQRLRQEGRLHVDLLQRFGGDLLEAVNHLEDQGINHRDIKPDNIAVGQVGRGDRLHLVLFDFSLSQTPPENIRAGTTGYLEPLLPLRKPPRWDLHAERYAVAVTLCEMATGVLPKWGDGTTDPSHSTCEMTIDSELFDVSLRDSLTEFFQKAFRREPRHRFDNAEEMLRAWRNCFEGIEAPGTLSDHENESDLRQLLIGAGLDTAIPELGLGVRATHALDRANILTVRELLAVPSRVLSRLRGVGNLTRREISTAVKILRQQLETADSALEAIRLENGQPAEGGKLSIDQFIQKITRTGSKEGALVQQIQMALLGLEMPGRWIGQAEVALHLNTPLENVNHWIGKFQSRWAKEPAVTKLRNDLVDILNGAGSVITLEELAEAILLARGSAQDEPLRTKLAVAALRVAIEVESTTTQPRFLIQRNQDQILIAVSQELANYARRLGDLADQLAEEDPLVPPLRAIQRLRELVLPEGVEVLSDARILRLAAAASQRAVVSSRQELYPRGMDAMRALKLSQGALYGVTKLTVQQIRERVSSRYPAAATLPDRPALDQMLREAGLELQWNSTAGAGGSYVSRVGGFDLTHSMSLARLSTATGGVVRAVSPEEADARQFEERLQRGIQEGTFQVLLVNHKYYQQAYHELCQRFPVQLIDFEQILLQALRQVADRARVNWDLVVQTDATPHQGDWDKLMLLVGRAMPIVEAQLAASNQTILLIYGGLLARYDQMTLLERLREQIGRPGGISGLWLLLPGDKAMIDDKAVPLLSPGQRARIPESWIENRHRARVVPAV
jgi:serine/threonine protein kinase